MSDLDRWVARDQQARYGYFKLGPARFYLGDGLWVLDPENPGDDEELHQGEGPGPETAEGIVPGVFPDGEIDDGQ